MDRWLNGCIARFSPTVFDWVRFGLAYCSSCTVVVSSDGVDDGDPGVPNDSDEDVAHSAISKLYW